MSDYFDQTNLISSVTHSEAVIRTNEKNSHFGVGNLSQSALSTADRVFPSRCIRCVAAS